MHPTLDKLFDNATPAARCLFAVGASTPFFVIFWAANWLAFVDDDIGRSLHMQPLTWLQAFLTGSIALALLMGRWLWLRRERTERLPWASLIVALNIGLAYVILMVAFGAFTAGTNVVMLGVLVIGMMLFDLRTMLIAFTVCLGLHIVYDAAVLAGLVPYSPVLTPAAFDGVQPTWWWGLWRDTVFYVGSVIVLLLIFLLFSRLDALHLQLDKLSHTDVLTGLANRRYFMERLESERRRHARTAGAYSLILLDVDHFKRINDRFGHHAGDEVLRHLSQVLIEGVRTPTDQSARIGGEEFAVLLPDTALEAAEVVCRRIADGLRAHEFELDGQRFRLTVSMGVIECRGQTSEDVLKQADRNLYQAKAQGRDRIVASVAEGVAA